METFAKKADERLDNLELNSAKSKSLSLSKGAWAKNTENTDFPYKYILPVYGVTAASRADAVLDNASVIIAAAAGMSTICDTAADSVIFRCREIPSATLTGTLYIKKKAAQSG